MKKFDVLILIIIILTALVVYLATTNYVWRIAFENLCQNYCNCMGYLRYKVTPFTCTCSKKLIGSFR